MSTILLCFSDTYNLILVYLMCALDFAFCCYSGDIYCGEVHEKIAAHSNTKVAPLGSSGSVDTCLIFDEDMFKSGLGSARPDIKKFCGVSSCLLHMCLLICIYSEYLCIPELTLSLFTWPESHPRILHAEINRA